MRNEYEMKTKELTAVNGSRDCLEAAADICERAAAGDLEARIVGLDESDAGLARLFNSINSMLDIADSYVRETAAAMSSCSEGKFHRPILLRGLKGAYQKSAGLINKAAVSMKRGQEQIVSLESERRQTAQRTQVSAETVSVSVAELREIAESISVNSGRTTEMAASVAETSRSTASNIGSMSAACEELDVSISEISKQTGESSTLTTNAVGEMGEVQETMAEMKEAVEKIGPVVSLIERISSQTNLLALNATIEASRAGKAGDGFAVVANEVKELSRVTASATEEIYNHVKTINGTTHKAVEAIHSISSAVSKINENASCVSNSLGEQAQATAHIAQNVATASQGAVDISEAINGVSDAVATTNSTVAGLNATATKLAQESEALQGEVSHLLKN